MVQVEAIIWYLFVIDSLGANIAVWLFPKSVTWYKKKLPRVSKHLPLTKGWAFIYLGLVLWVGYMLFGLSFI